MADDAKVVTATKRNKLPIRASLKRWPWIPIIILVGLLIAIIFAPLLTPHSPEVINLPNRLMPPCWAEGGSSTYLLGTDSLGRDLLTRIIYGARISILVAVVTIAISGGIGLLLGIMSGYMGGWVDAVISRAIDAFLGLPALLLALVFAVTLGPSMTTIIIALTVVTWARFARVVRSEALSIRTRDFILQAKVAGCSTPRILLNHVTPNTFNTFMVLASFELGAIVIIEASLSFLGAGIPPPTPSWGQMVAEGKDYITSAWWIALFPGLALGLTVFAFQLFGDWLRDRLDPKLRQI